MPGTIQEVSIVLFQILLNFLCVRTSIHKCLENLQTLHSSAMTIYFLQPSPAEVYIEPFLFERVTIGVFVWLESTKDVTCGEARSTMETRPACFTIEGDRPQSAPSSRNETGTQSWIMSPVLVHSNIPYIMNYIFEH
ncbi:hypothetical protein AVEN_102541-1 [Araneus ventricosus]|uniref:Uncharacterized protein n=1 Tax=Araneus ventricosus TaxID=182803 RepID=A0A4Y2BK24_ARAVE|nr:hypothetical protein AVEN_102541-1 [Araneus ventricosus]